MSDRLVSLLYFGLVPSFTGFLFVLYRLELALLGFYLVFLLKPVNNEIFVVFNGFSVVFELVPSFTGFSLLCVESSYLYWVFT